MRVLFVDDNLDLRECFVLYAKMNEIDCDLAEDGVEGLQKSQENDYDFIITDGEMPNMGGIELVQRILEIKPNSNIIAFSARTHINQEMIKCGAEISFAKDARELIAFLKENEGRVAPQKTA